MPFFARWLRSLRAASVPVLIVRDDVHPADAVRTLQVRVFADTTVADLVNEVIRPRPLGFLPSIQGRRATWVVEYDRPLAVLAQQWSEPRFLVEPGTPAMPLLAGDPQPALRVSYHLQADPDVVFAALHQKR